MKYHLTKTSIINYEAVYEDLDYFDSIDEAKKYIEDNISGEFEWIYGEDKDCNLWWAQQSRPFIAWCIYWSKYD